MVMHTYLQYKSIGTKLLKEQDLLSYFSITVHLYEHMVKLRYYSFSAFDFSRIKSEDLASKINLGTKWFLLLSVLRQCFSVDIMSGSYLLYYLK